MILIKEKNYQGQISFCGLSEEILYPLFRNGSVTGKLVEPLVCQELGYQKSEHSQDFYDVTQDGKLWEVRCFTQYGASLIPSNQVGAGRKYNEKEFFEKLDNIAGFIFIDIRQFPKMTFYKCGGWEAQRLFDKKITVSKFEKFLRENVIESEI